MAGASGAGLPAIHTKREQFASGFTPITYHHHHRRLVSYRTTPLRGLAQHAPYFHDGSAAPLADVVDHYDRFLSFGLTTAQKQDLIAYLQTL